jgi:transcriptional regulator with XRE-family HTH domain
MEEILQIGKNISRYRKKNGMTQLDLAVACGMEKNSIGRLETGRTNPTAKTLLKIAKALNVTLSELVKFRNTNARK